MFAAAWIGMAFVPVIGVHKGGDEPAFYFSLGYLYLGLLRSPTESLPLLIASLPLVAGHLAAALAAGALASLLARLARRA